MRMKTLIILCFVLFAEVAHISLGCHNHLERERRDVSGVFENNDRTAKMANFFRKCMERKMRNVPISIRSVVDFAILDTKWFTEQDLFYCSGKSDTKYCWRRMLDFLVDRSSVFSKPAKACISKYSDAINRVDKKSVSSAGRRKRQAVWSPSYQFAPDSYNNIAPLYNGWDNIPPQYPPQQNPGDVQYHYGVGWDGVDQSFSWELQPTNPEYIAPTTPPTTPMTHASDRLLEYLLRLYSATTTQPPRPYHPTYTYAAPGFHQSNPAYILPTARTTTPPISTTKPKGVTYSFDWHKFTSVPSPPRTTVKPTRRVSTPATKPAHPHRPKPSSTQGPAVTPKGARVLVKPPRPSPAIRPTSKATRRPRVTPSPDRSNSCPALATYTSCVKRAEAARGNDRDVNSILKFVENHLSRCSNRYKMPESANQRTKICVKRRPSAINAEEGCVAKELRDSIIVPNSPLRPLLTKCSPPSPRRRIIGVGARSLPFNPMICDGKWTEWFNLYDPRSSTGDFETLWEIRLRFTGSVCANPTQVDYQLADGRNLYSVNDVLEISKEDGLLCENSQQPSGMCNDYKVRFCCPNDL